MGIAVITGASSGIGREYVRQLALSGQYRELWLIARTEEKLRQVQDYYPKAPMRLLPLDLTEPASWQVYLKELQESGRKIGLLVNCAGIGKIGNTIQVGLAASVEMIDLNVRALTALTLLSLPLMEEGGRIIEMASAAGFQPLPNLNVYAASKAYVLHFAEALAYELKPYGLTVTAVCPNWVGTPFIGKAKLGQGGGAIHNFGKLASPEAVVKKVLDDAARGKLISAYGLRNRAQQILSRFAPPSLVMRFWQKISR